MKKNQLDAMAVRIKRKRKSFNLTQEEAAERLKISYSSYTKIENGLQNPSVDTLISISLILQMTLDEIVFGYDENLEENPAEMRALIAALKSCDREKMTYALEKLSEIVSCLK